MKTIKSSQSTDVYWPLFALLHRDIADTFKPTLAELEHDDDLIIVLSSDLGMDFFTKVLPEAAKSLDKALGKATTFVPGDLVNQHLGSHFGYPTLFQWLWRRVLNEDASVREDADIQAIRALRQLLYFLYKVELPYDETTEQRVLDAFVTNDFACPAKLPRDPILLMATSIITRVIGDMDPRNIRPAHGPGAVSTGERANEKSRFSRYYHQLHSFYSFEEWFMWSLDHMVMDWKRFKAMPTLRSGTAKVVLVPKDSRGPRIISCEPLEYMWIQQGLARAIMARVESHRWTSGFVNFTNQDVNRHLALSSSKTRHWATLDLKDASDRVSLALVKELFGGTRLLAGLLAARSSHTLMPDRGQKKGEVIRLRKFAPMGSATCFPVEALCFWAISVAALSLHGYGLKRALRSVYVYGDDLIVPTEVYGRVCAALESVHLTVNYDKSCAEGFFRESCGMDAYKGIDVTPVKIRTPWSSRRTPEALTSWSSYSNELFARGFVRAAEGIRRVIERKFARLPFTSSSEEGFPSFVRPEWSNHIRNSKRVRIRFNHRLQRWECRTWTVKPVMVSGSEFLGYELLLRSLCAGDVDTQGGCRHALARRVVLTRAWAPLNLFD